MLRRGIARALFAGASVIALLSTGTTAHAAPVSVTNKTQFTDSGGAVIHAHGGGVIKVGSSYYWFGENRNADNTFKAVSMYRSTDLKSWVFQRDVLTSASHPELASAKIERPKVIYNSSTGKYVMWMHKEQGLPANHYTEARAAVAVSDTIDGDYTWQGSFRAPDDATSRDQTLFKDSDGSAYQITSSDQNADLHIYKLNASYTGYDRLVANPWDGKFREAPALFKRDGVYFMLTSGNSGWSPNQQKYATATSLAGPWTAMADVGDSEGYGSQTAFVLPVQGTSGTSYLYMGDRWGNSFGGTVNDSQYVWLPLKFPTRTTMVMPYYPQVTIDTTAGTVSGSGGGPYYNLVARHSQKCVDISENSAANKAAVLQYTCNGGLNQQWRLVDKGNGYVNLKAQHSGKCLDVSGASVEDRGVVQQYDCTGSANQQWKLQDQGDGYYRLAARHSGKCLDVSGVSTADGARLFQYTCGSGANQQFKRPAV
ncbi:RICIN domain-containing protein [Streptomyces baarnensis]|uniref:RICIN domain-containing protein n=1 Tax=Streptomyces TaxID=1883 RepID=UPI0029A1480F|nr:RICIN domain-containing protein [Streptomyces sp. ME02-6979.5a]MDX3342625.1 RICIN domain-containing protein [Streptomyces sp. ME02-6979.5a]